MRKRIISTADGGPRSADWLDLESLATVELSSEDPAHPFEAALADGGVGWRAGSPGAQTVRVVFDAPQRIGRVRLCFEEAERSRTQEFALLWSADGREFRELVRQQWTFHPPTGSRELEVYEVALDGVKALELRIRPDLGDGSAVASLAELRVG